MVMDTATRNAFLRALDEDPTFYEEVRRRVLGDELLALPQRLAEFIEATERRLASLETTLTDFTTAQSEFNAEQREFNANLLAFTTAQSAFNAEQREFNRQTLEYQKRTDEHLASIDAHAARTDARIDRILDDLGLIKGRVVIYAAQAHHEFILEELGFNFVKMLPRDEIVSMLRDADAAGDIAFSDRRSFYEADVVIRVTDSQDAIHYVVMEASFTADRRDTNRVVRNAEYLTRFTGCPAHPVIVSLRNDREIQPLLDDGTVHWYQITEQDLLPR